MFKALLEWLYKDELKCLHDFEIAEAIEFQNNINGVPLHMLYKERDRRHNESVNTGLVNENISQ